MRARRRLIAVLAVAIGLLVAPSAWAAGAAPVLTGSVTNATTLSGATFVAVAGTMAYTTAYFPGDLTAVDISNPANPTITGNAFAPALGGTVPAGESTSTGAVMVSIAGGYAFVTSKNHNGPCLPGTGNPVDCSQGTNDDGSGNSLTIFDVHSNPAVPAYVGAVSDPTSGPFAGVLLGAYGIAVSGRYAYVAAQGCLGGQPCPNSGFGNAFVIIDLAPISGPPVIVAAISNSNLPAPWAGSNALNHVDSVAVSGNFAYVTAFNSATVTVLDITNPLSPTIKASIADFSNLKFANDVAVRGNYAFVADQTGPSGLTAGFTVLDISNPAHPAVVASIPNSSLLHQSYTLRLSGNFAYVSAKNSASIVAIDISDPTNPQIIGSITDSTRLNQTTGLDFQPVGAYIIATSFEGPGQQQALYPPFLFTTGTLSTIQLDPQPIGVTIAPASEPAAETTSTSADFNFSTTDLISVVDCSLDGAAYTNCMSSTSQQYGSLPVGNHTFSVQATDAAGNTATANYSWAVEQTPANTAAPTVSGSTIQSKTLTATTGTWTGGNLHYVYAWNRCNAAGTGCGSISGATSSTYTLTSSDVGHALQVTVTATNGVGSATAFSKSTSAVTACAAGQSGAPPNCTTPQKITLTLSPPGHQKVIKQKAVFAQVTCNVSARIGAYVEIKIGKAKPFRVKSLISNVNAGKKTKFKIVLTKSQLKKLKSALKHHRKITATVFGERAVGSSGNSFVSTKGRSFRITS